MSEEMNAEELRAEVRNLKGALHSALGNVLQLKENARADHHMLIVLRERINDLTSELQAARREV
jgi:hypothetical protein